MVAVTPDVIHCAPGCFVCAEPEAAPVSVRFTRTIVLVVLGGIESTTVVVPLCSTHRTRYHARMRAISAFQVVCGLVALLCFGALFATFERPDLEPYQPLLATLGCVAVGAAYLSIGVRSTAIPVRFRRSSRGRVPFSASPGTYVFTFEDRASAARFYDANAER